IFLDEPRPQFTIMGAAEFENLPRTDEQIERLPPGIALSDTGHLPDDAVRIPGHPALARHIFRCLADAPFDVSYASEQVRPDPDRAQTGGMPHAYGFVYKQLMRENVTPHVPIDTNTLFPPSQPTTRECYEFGKSVAVAIDSWEEDARVCVIASGGLSHFVVDEEFDHDILTAMAGNDFERLCNYPESYYQAGSSEIKSWIAAGGAMSGGGLEGTVVEYQALYRTAAGTGSCAAFMTWK
ncbi:MAG: protocatechuate 3,4-dioxygenase, partial [Gammaproteobacteria bacterium]|nr:protocatechuate 3,4-dioxygenase [Gammaproteobacteria bacterium]